MAAACGATPDEPAAPPAPVWQGVEVAFDAQGVTEPVRFALPHGARALALRARGRAAGCYALQDVVVNDGTTWVPTPTTSDYGDYCSACAQRVSVGGGYALSILPSAAEEAPALELVRARVALRDCVTLTPDASAAPERLLLEISSWQPPAASEPLRLPFAVVLATQVGFAQDAELLPAALGALQRTWGQAGIRLELEARAEITPPSSALEYTASDSSALVSLRQRARAALPGELDARWPVLIFGPCLRRMDLIDGGRSEPWGLTPHVPGGSGVGDAPDQIFIAAERCEGLAPAPRWDDAAQLGAVLAHELGHYLGLYHVVEADGRPDALSDTSAADPNLMRATPGASSTLLSVSQIAIARRHNAFARPPQPQP